MIKILVVINLCSSCTSTTTANSSMPTITYTAVIKNDDCSNRNHDNDGAEEGKGGRKKGGERQQDSLANNMTYLSCISFRFPCLLCNWILHMRGSRERERTN